MIYFYLEILISIALSMLGCVSLVKATQQTGGEEATIAFLVFGCSVTTATLIRVIAYMIYRQQIFWSVYAYNTMVYSSCIYLWFIEFDGVDTIGSESDILTLSLISYTTIGFVCLWVYMFVFASIVTCMCNHKNKTQVDVITREDVANYIV